MLALEHFAAGDQLRAFLLADADVVEVLLELRLVDDRADVGAGLERIVDLELGQPLGQRGDESVVDALADDQPRRRGAALAGREERAVDRAIDRHGQVGIVQDDQRILAAHFELELGHALRSLSRRSRGRSRPSR